MKRITSFVLILLVAAAVVAAQAQPRHSGLASITNVGHGKVQLARSMRLELERAGIAPRARLLAVRGRKSFVRLGGPGNDHCYGVNKKGNGSPFGITCWNDFPSATHPILDLSTFGADGGGPVHVLDAQGIAADGVASIVFTDAGGAVVARAPVTANIYTAGGVPVSAVRIVALDAEGRMLFAVPN
jgi:hypothetical protein